jgi:hypothetical protein
MGSDGSAVMHHHAMVALFLSLLGALRSALRTHADLALENLALRQQLAYLRRPSSRPRLSTSDRAFWLVVVAKKAFRSASGAGDARVEGTANPAAILR